MSVQGQCCLSGSLLKAPYSLAFNTSRDGESMTSLGSIFQCLSTLTARSFFLKPNLNIPSSSLKLFPLVLLFYALVTCPSPAPFKVPSRYWNYSKVSLEHSLLQAEQAQLSQPVFTGEVVQPFDHL